MSIRPILKGYVAAIIGIEIVACAVPKGVNQCISAAIGSRVPVNCFFVFIVVPRIRKIFASTCEPEGD